MTAAILSRRATATRRPSEARHGHNGAVVASLSGMHPAGCPRKYRRPTTRRQLHPNRTHEA